MGRGLQGRVVGSIRPNKGKTDGKPLSRAAVTGVLEDFAVHFTNGNSMSLQPPDTNGQQQWESVHQCPKCGHTVNLGEMDLRAISTGMIVCPRCEWSGPVRIEIVEPEDAD
jgi:predicted RNA-binding Zn-ribbon protein involved in translation (DUF1610 family)